MNRIDREKNTIWKMIELYCCRKEHNAALCTECVDLLGYAYRKLDACRFGKGKPSCKRCMVHCYTPARRDKIRVVMRYAGPRMVLFHPIAAFRHLLG